MKKTVCRALNVFLLLLLTGFAAWAANGVDLTIRLYNQKIYFPGDSIQVRLTITNNGPEVYRFNLADQKFHNLDFDVRGMNNINAGYSNYIINARTQQQHVYYRNVDIRPGEEFSFIEDLSRYRRLDDGIYMFQARFFPQLMGVEGQMVLASNNLTLSVREGFRRQDASEIRIAKAMEEEMEIAALAPDEVVSYTIEARMHSRRSEFLQYLDVENLYVARQQRADRYARLSAIQRQEELDGYKDVLWNEETPEGMSLIPDSYEIQRTNYGPNTGSVTVLQKYDLGEYLEIKRFTYELERRDEIWYIVGYLVTNLGTE